jgi:hypothetical protein
LESELPRQFAKIEAPSSNAACFTEGFKEMTYRYGYEEHI